jgi:NhaP-type Na+/H+ or K+/H+ antiporter
MNICLFRLFKVHNFKIKLSEKSIMSCAGSIRGAIAFGLAISIDSKNRMNKEVLVSSTLILVFFTTIVFGALMPFLIKFFQSLDPPTDAIAITEKPHQEHEEEQIYTFMHPNFEEK